MKTAILILLIILCASFASALSTQLSNSNPVVGEKITLTITEGKKGIYPNVLIFSGRRHYGSLKTENPFFAIEKEKFSPGKNVTVLTYTPQNKGPYYFRIYDYDTSKNIEVPFTVSDLPYAVKRTCSLTKTYALRTGCDENFCAKKGFERAGCVKDKTHYREVCKQIRVSACGKSCPRGWDLESVEQCTI